MGTIKKFNSQKNLKSFKRLFNYKDSSPTYEIDSLRNTDGWERLYNSSNYLSTTVAELDIQGSMSGVRFENDSSLTLTETIENTYTLYKVSGTCDAMTEEQATAWSSEAVAGETTFLVITYACNFLNAANRRTAWVSAVDEETTDVKSLPSSGYQTTVLGISGPGTVNESKPYYKIDIIDSEGNVLKTYVFDVSSLYQGD